MKKIKLNKQFCLAAAAFVLLAGVCAKDAMAYFTTYATAKGGVVMNLEFTETIPNDDVAEQKKTVSIKNDKNYPCFVRLKVFMGSEIAKLMDEGDYILGNGWSKSGDYYHYDMVLQPGEQTSDFVINLSDVLGKTAEELKMEEFNVIVIQECAPVIYNEDGAAEADWDGSDYTIYSE